MSYRKVSAQLATDMSVGAGNVLPSLLARGAPAGTQAITFDSPAGGHPAWQPLTLGETVAAHAPVTEQECDRAARERRQGRERHALGRLIGELQASA